MILGSMSAVGTVGAVSARAHSISSAVGRLFARDRSFCPLLLFGKDCLASRSVNCGSCTEKLKRSHLVASGTTAVHICNCNR